MQITRAPGSTGGTSSTVSTASAGPIGTRLSAPSGSAQNSSRPATTSTSVPSSSSRPTRTDPVVSRTPTMRVIAFLTSAPVPADRRHAFTLKHLDVLCYNCPMTTPPLRDLATAGAPSRAEQLAAVVEKRVRRDGLAAGSSLGTIDDLQQASGYSRPTVSEAVRLLRDRGVVRIKPGRGGGLFVAERGPVVRLRHTRLSVDEEPTTVAEAIELRDHLELLIDLGAARCRSEEDVADLRRLVAQMGDAVDWQAFMRANWALHERIAAICPNAMARAVYVGTLGHITGSSASYADGADSSA